MVLPMKVHRSPSKCPGSWSEVGEGLAYVCTQPLLAPFQGPQGSPALCTSKSIATFFNTLSSFFQSPKGMYLHLPIKQIVLRKGWENGSIVKLLQWL